MHTVPTCPLLLGNFCEASTSLLVELPRLWLWIWEWSLASTPQFFLQIKRDKVMRHLTNLYAISSKIESCSRRDWLINVQMLLNRTERGLQSSWTILTYFGFRPSQGLEKSILWYQELLYLPTFFHKMSFDLDIFLAEHPLMYTLAPPPYLQINIFLMRWHFRCHSMVPFGT